MLSNAGGFWSVILPLSAYKLMNEIVEESQRSANPVIRKDRLGDTNLPLSNMVSIPQRGHEGKKNRIKIPRLINAVMSGLPAEIFLAINVVFVGAG